MAVQRARNGVRRRQKKTRVLLLLKLVRVAKRGAKRVTNRVIQKQPQILISFQRGSETSLDNTNKNNNNNRNNNNTNDTNNNINDHNNNNNDLADFL